MIQNPIIAGKEKTGTNSGWDVLEEVSLDTNPSTLLETTCDYMQQLEAYGDVYFAFFCDDENYIVLSQMPPLDITDTFMSANLSVYAGIYAANTILLNVSIIGDTDSNVAGMTYEIQLLSGGGSTDIFTYFNKMQIVRIKI